ncbi:uncharacterized protein LOC122261748 [Penaeus japonicus]|uniref:uncharacterized protein LOC122261748 n=1 Tax=Penaeus japonicus TaxID=27405 RepID=UPI001C711798|nr:uncharacterized protein LOC122261748 [Penaeus japonicus]
MLGEPDGAPTCRQNPCAGAVAWMEGQVLVPFRQGGCVALGSTRPCPPGKLVGYSISRRVGVCVTLTEAGYAQSQESVEILSRIYPRFPNMSFREFVRDYADAFSRRQAGTVTDPLFPNLAQTLVPNPGTILDTPLLTQCRPGAARDANYKCRDVVLGPSVDVTNRGETAPPVPPLQTCPNDQCYDITAMCVTCEQAVVSTCALSASLSLQQDACQILAQGLGK